MKICDKSSNDAPGERDVLLRRYLDLDGQYYLFNHQQVAHSIKAGLYPRPPTHDGVSCHLRRRCPRKSISRRCSALQWFQLMVWRVSHDLQSIRLANLMFSLFVIFRDFASVYLHVVIWLSLAFSTRTDSISLGLLRHCTIWKPSTVGDLFNGMTIQIFRGGTNFVGDTIVFATTSTCCLGSR